VFWRIAEVLMGLLVVGLGLFTKEFTPIDWTTVLIWGRGQNARIPEIAGPFYVLLRAFLHYIGITGK
jgi:hypothetical protein